MYLTIIKAIYEKSTAHIIPNVQKLKVFLFSSRIRYGYPLSPLLFNTVVEVLATVIRQEEEIKDIQIGKEEVKLSFFTDDMIVYKKIPVVYTKKLLDLCLLLQQSSKIQSQYSEINGILVDQQ